MPRLVGLIFIGYTIVVGDQPEQTKRNDKKNGRFIAAARRRLFSAAAA
jgi:hypothetical protein